MNPHREANPPGQHGAGPGGHRETVSLPSSQCPRRQPGPTGRGEVTVAADRARMSAWSLSSRVFSGDNVPFPCSPRFCQREPCPPPLCSRTARVWGGLTGGVSSRKDTDLNAPRPTTDLAVHALALTAEGSGQARVWLWPGAMRVAPLILGFLRRKPPRTCSHTRCLRIKREILHVADAPRGPLSVCPHLLP